MLTPAKKGHGDLNTAAVATVRTEKTNRVLFGCSHDRVYFVEEKQREERRCKDRWDVGQTDDDIECRRPRYTQSVVLVMHPGGAHSDSTLRQKRHEPNQKLGPSFAEVFFVAFRSERQQNAVEQQKHHEVVGNQRRRQLVEDEESAEVVEPGVHAEKTVWKKNK